MAKRELKIIEKVARTLAIAGFVIALTFGLSTWRFTMGSAKPKPADQPPMASRPAVVVELFTSEGCSSCPPADKLLSWLGQTQPLPDVEIIPLSEHVDYWNHLGWADPYSSSKFSQRQHEYTETFSTGAYTPQMIVDGKAEFVGSDSRRALEAISNDSRAPKAMVKIQPVVLGDSIGKNRVSFSVEVGSLPLKAAGERSVIFLAVTENNLQSSVERGENSGRTLAHTAVVRELKQIGKLETRADAHFRAQPQVEISKNWKRADLRAVVFVQLEDSRRILGAAESLFPVTK